MYVLVYLVHVIYVSSLQWCGVEFTPILTPAELLKTVVTHYLSTEKARAHFNYSPTRPNDLSDIIRGYTHYFE